MLSLSRGGDAVSHEIESLLGAGVSPGRFRLDVGHEVQRGTRLSKKYNEKFLQ